MSMVKVVNLNAEGNYLWRVLPGLTPSPLFIYETWRMNYRMKLKIPALSSSVITGILRLMLFCFKMLTAKCIFFFVQSKTSALDAAMAATLAAYKPPEKQSLPALPPSPKPVVYRDKREAMEALKDLLKVGLLPSTFRAVVNQQTCFVYATCVFGMLKMLLWQTKIHQKNTKKSKNFYQNFTVLNKKNNRK